MLNIERDVTFSVYYLELCVIEFHYYKVPVRNIVVRCASSKQLKELNACLLLYCTVKENKLLVLLNVNVFIRTRKALHYR